MKRFMLWCLAFLAMVSCSVLPATGQAKPATDVAVVVNPGTPVEGLTLAEVRKVFRGDRQYWTPEVPVVLLVRAPVARERSVVLKAIYQMDEAQFKQYWVAKIFRGENASAPKIIYSNQLADQLLSAVPGAIAFMDAKDVRPGLKVLPIDGLKPGQPGYPLR